MEFRTLREDELDRWSAHCAKVFGEKDGHDYGTYFIDKWYNDPWRDIDGIFVAVEDGVICSTVRVFFRSIYLGGQEVSMGGIGEVSTKPEFKGRGLASELLKRSIALMEDRGIAVSMLGTGINDFYARLGWKSSNMIWKSLSANGECGSSTACLRPVDISRDLDAIKRIYSEYSGRFNGPIVRNSDFYWSGWLKPENDFWLQHDSNGEPSAYMSIVEGNSAVWVGEFGTIGNEADTFNMLLKGILRHKGKGKCEVKYPAAIYAGIDNGTVEIHNGSMYRLINPFSINGQTIDSTEMLIKLLEGEHEAGRGTRHCFWNKDSF